MVVLAQWQARQYVVLLLAPFDALEEVNCTLRGNTALVEQIDAETPGLEWPNVKIAAIERPEHQKSISKFLST